MTLDEAIKHEEEIVKEEQYEYQECVATHNMEGAKNCRKYAEEHRQLAEWLKDYRRLLEQQPCDDCVSRDMALEKMADYVASGYADSAEDFEEYSRIICQLPPITPQLKTGRWISKPNIYGVVYCSKCDYELHTNNTNYCPNCGAKMESDIHCTYTDSEIAKSFIEDVEAVKDLLPITESEE